MGELLGMEGPHVSLAAEKLGQLGPLIITNSMVMMLLSMVVVVLLMTRGAARIGVQPGGRLAMLVETVIDGLLGLVQGVSGRTLGRRIFPLIGTLFIFIVLANWLALLPGVGTVGLCEKGGAYAAEKPAAEGAAKAEVKPAAKTEGATAEAAPHRDTCPKGTHFVGLLRPANADLNMTIAMALIAVGAIQFVGIQSHGVGGYLKELATPWFLFPVHVISELSRILSLSARLFGNIFGGEVFLIVIFFLFPLLAPLIPIGLELFFGLIQAVLFSVLTLVYLSMAAAGHGSHGDEHGHEAHGAHDGHHAPAHAGD